MNGFHVQAVGWILVCNARALSPQEGRELSERWAALVRARAEDSSQTSLVFRLLLPRSIPLSENSSQAFTDLMECMAALHPERFECEALRRRRNHWALQAALSLLVGALAAIWLPEGWPLTREVVVTLFVMGCGLLVPTATLWRATAAVRSLCAKPHSKMESWSLPGKPNQFG